MCVCVGVIVCMCVCVCLCLCLCVCVSVCACVFGLRRNQQEILPVCLLLVSQVLSNLLTRVLVPNKNLYDACLTHWVHDQSCQPANPKRNDTLTIAHLGCLRWLVSPDEVIVAKITDPQHTLPVSILGKISNCLGQFGGPGRHLLLFI